MSAPKPPITRLYFWLAVSALVLTGAPVPQQSAGRARDRQQLATADDLAKVFAAQDLAHQDSAQLPQARTGTITDAPFSARAVMPGFVISSRCARRPACSAAVPRLSLVRTIELRI